MHRKRITLKHCPKCGLDKQLNEFGRDSSRLDGRYTYCKACRLRPVSQQSIEQEELAAKRLKKCTKCCKVKPFEAFNGDSTKKYGISSSCKKCQKDYKIRRASAWYAEQEEIEYLFSNDKARCTKCGSVKRLDKFLKSRTTKIGIYRLCKDCNNEYRRKRCPSSRDYTNWEVFEEDDFTCYLCEETLDPRLRHPHPKSLSIDHVNPISLGGLDQRDNVRTACLECNLDKRARPLDVYLELKNIG